MGNSSIISTSVFIVTTMVCALFTYLTGHYEKTLTKISKKVQNLENNLAKVETIALNYEHVLKCILYTAVHVCEEIHGIKITQKCVSFKDIKIINNHGHIVPFKINRQKQTWDYRCLPYSDCYPDDTKDLLIECSPVHFKYIEFENLYAHNGGNTMSIILLFQDSETTVQITTKEHILCNTAYCAL